MRHKAKNPGNALLLVALIWLEPGNGSAQAVNYRAELRLAWQSYTNGNYFNSLAHYQWATQAAPQSLDAQLGCVLTLLSLGKYPEAETAARRILKSYPANYYANLRLAYALRMQKQFESAEMILSQSLALRPTDVPLLKELALVKMAIKQYARACQILLDVLTLAPDDTTAIELLTSLQLRQNPQDGLYVKSYAASPALLDPNNGTKISYESAIYYGYLEYHDTAVKDHADSIGIYAALLYGFNHLWEFETDYFNKFYRGFASLEQWDTTLAYANFSLPHVKLRAGGHLVSNSDPYTDQGWLAFGGAEYFVANCWAAGIDGYFTQYPKFQTQLEVAQLTPHLGITFGQSEHPIWNNDLRGYWIYVNSFGGRHHYFSVEDRLSLSWQHWTLATFGWVGQQLFAVRNDGFALYNLGEVHKAGVGAEVSYAFSPHFTITLRANHETFQDLAITPYASSDMYLAMLRFKF